MTTFNRISHVLTAADREGREARELVRASYVRPAPPPCVLCAQGPSAHYAAGGSTYTWCRACYQTARV